MCPPREFRLAEPDVAFYFENYFERLPQCILEKLSSYLLGGDRANYNRRTRVNGSTYIDFGVTPIKTLAVIDWLSPGYHRNNEEAKRKRIVTGINVTAPNEEIANKEIGRLLEEKVIKVKKTEERDGNFLQEQLHQHDCRHLTYLPGLPPFVNHYEYYIREAMPPLCGWFFAERKKIMSEKHFNELIYYVHMQGRPTYNKKCEN